MDNVRKSQWIEWERSWARWTVDGLCEENKDKRWC